jgi:hypothetical protein
VSAECATANQSNTGSGGIDAEIYTMIRTTSKYERMSDEHEDLKSERALYRTMHHVCTSNSPIIMSSNPFATFATVAGLSRFLDLYSYTVCSLTTGKLGNLFSVDSVSLSGKRGP